MKDLFIIVVAVLTISRVVKCLSSNICGLKYFTTYSNTLSLLMFIMFLCDKKNECIFSAISNISFAMFCAFWFVYITFGEKALYGKYDPLLYEIYIDHLLIPVASMTLAILNNCYKNSKENIKCTLMLGIVWVCLTLYAGPAYPFLRDSKGEMNISKLAGMITLFGALSCCFDYICCKKKDEK